MVEPGVELADAEAAMTKGRGTGLYVLIALAVVLLGGVFFLMGGNDEQRVYSELGKQINGIKQTKFDPFWGCALPGANLADLKSNADLSFQIDARAAEKGQRYGVHVREACLSMLADIQPTLDTLIVGEDLKKPVADMSDAASKLRSAWSGLVAYLDDPELSYDAEVAKTHIQPIVRAWFEFKTAHGAVNKALKAKLEP
jgi:hypothetical protein